MTSSTSTTWSTPSSGRPPRGAACCATSAPAGRPRSTSSTGRWPPRPASTPDAEHLPLRPGRAAAEHRRPQPGRHPAGLEALDRAGRRVPRPCSASVRQRGSAGAGRGLAGDRRRSRTATGRCAGWRRRGTNLVLSWCARLGGRPPPRGTSRCLALSHESAPCPPCSPPSPPSACPPTSSPPSTASRSPSRSPSSPPPSPTPWPAATCAARRRPARARPWPSGSVPSAG